MIKGDALPEKIKVVWRISALGTLIFGLLITGGLLFAQHFWGWWQWLVLAALALTVVYTLIGFAIIPYRYRYWRYRISTDSVEIESGFFFHVLTAIPISRIQNVTLEAGPILQWQHLQTVNIETAATTHKIESVLPVTAEQLKEQIMTLATGVVDDDTD
ncbi:PH domain-containing protein [Secundilactobacillus folii]|uniref:PH domain-containing protein n=1 Tax=Secundilactobacillus folii TaxID=2678357 RepID=A0A7X3C3M8_9LACO|nr:PH domain-containing protein [Secundilactobacillus folii]MTV82771.1 PH domain-containing protein [Secundilactobacillus folii]